MVSKIAVMALVAVVAVPILLGYGLNIDTQTRSVWAENNDPVNARDFLTSAFDATGATFMNADIYQMNSNIFSGSPGIKMYPQYVSTTTTRTSIQSAIGTVNTSFNLIGSNGYSQVLVNGGYDTVNYYSVRLLHSGVNYGDYNYVKYFVFNIDGTVELSYYTGLNYLVNVTRADITDVSFTAVGSPSAFAIYNYTGAPYIDISKGYRLNMDGIVWNPSNYIPPSGASQTKR